MCRCLILTEYYEACVCVGGSQWILRSAAVHGAIELCRNSLQNKNIPFPLSTAIQQQPPDTRPCEQRFGKHLVLQHTTTQKYLVLLLKGLHLIVIKNKTYYSVTIMNECTSTMTLILYVSY